MGVQSSLIQWNKDDVLLRRYRWCDSNIRLKIMDQRTRMEGNHSMVELVD